MAAGAAFLDYDNDGFLDLYLIEGGSLEAEPTYVNRRYRNNGDGTFIDVTEQAQVGNSDWSTGCAFLDYDLDSDLDLYVVKIGRASCRERG